MIDFNKIRQDAEWVKENHDGSMAAIVAEWLLHFMAHPEQLLPQGYAVVKKPELLGLGVPRR